MSTTSLLGVLFGLASAFIWGAGDFTGGFATRRSSQFQVLAVSALSGLLILVIPALALREPFPGTRDLLYAALGGASGAMGIAILYRALSTGHAASVAPTAAVTSAALPVLFSAVTQSLPTPLQFLGFGLAAAGIWMLSAEGGSAGRMSRGDILTAATSGVGFGFFFIFLGLLETSRVFTPVIVARSATLAVGLLFLGVYRQPLPSLRANPVALLAGVLDAGGNIFYVLASQYARLDVAAVLASLYPASTVILASMVLKQAVSPRQWIAVLICLAAIVLITM